MLSSEKTVINGNGYEVRTLPYKLGRKVLFRLHKVLGPAVAKGLANVPNVGSLADFQVERLAPMLSGALEKLAEALSEEDFDFIADTLAEYTLLSKGDDKWVPLKQEMEFHFSGNYPEFFKWFGFALKVNFSGFFGERGFGAALANLQAKAASKSRSTSIGTPTGSPAPGGTAPV